MLQLVMYAINNKISLDYLIHQLIRKEGKEFTESYPINSPD